jgi:hypothetical protein
VVGRDHGRDLAFAAGIDVIGGLTRVRTASPTTAHTTLEDGHIAAVELTPPAATAITYWDSGADLVVPPRTLDS